jgi:hypothetical protein
MDDYPDPDSPCESDSDDDRLYIDLDPPANYQRRTSVNCFTTPLNKKVIKDSEVPATVSKDKSLDTPTTYENENVKKVKDRSAEKPVKSKAKSAKSAEKSANRKSRPERDEKERGNKSRDGKRRKRRIFVNKSTQTDLELIIPSNMSSLLKQNINLEHGQEVMQSYRTRERSQGLAGMRDRIWQNRLKRPFGPEPAYLHYFGEEPPAKRERGPSQEDDDSDMDPPIRTIT